MSRRCYGCFVVVELVLDDELAPPSPGLPGTTVVLSVDVFVVVFVDGPGTGTTVVVFVSLPGSTVVVCVFVVGGFSTVVSHPARPTSASANTAPTPYPFDFILMSLVFFVEMLNAPPSSRMGGQMRERQFSLLA